MTAARLQIEVPLTVDDEKGIWMIVMKYIHNWSW